MRWLPCNPAIGGLSALRVVQNEFLIGIWREAHCSLGPPRTAAFIASGHSTFAARMSGFGRQPPKFLTCHREVAFSESCHLFSSLTETDFSPMPLSAPGSPAERTSTSSRPAEISFVHRTVPWHSSPRWAALKFTDQAAFEAYSDAPEHQALLSWLVPLIEAIENDFTV